MNARLNKMIADGTIPLAGGVWIDCFNQNINAECAGTIIAGINSKNHYFVTEMEHETDTREIRDDKPQVLGWTRDAKGEVIDRHPVEVANAVTAAKRDNTQNYVCCAIRGRGENNTPQLELRKDGVTNALTSVQLDNHLTNGVRIRKLTPRECFRLMGVRDEDIDKIQAAGISKTQQYKMAGNSIVVNCLAAIFRQMFIGNFNKYIQTEII